jgi:isopenicillin-N epimerase
MTMPAPAPGPLARFWALDPRLVHLNHGSFGACPIEVLATQERLRQQLELDPTGFFLDRCPALWNDALRALAQFLNAPIEGLTFQPNATAGVNTVVRSLALRTGDEVLVLDHAYQACRNAVAAACSRAGAQVTVVALPFPPKSEDDIVDRVLAAAGPRTRLAMFDTVTSPTALRLPFERLTAALQARGIDVLLDAAHGPGIVPLDLTALGAAYVTGNCHKWLCTPKGSGFLYVRADRRDALEPLIVSHGYSAPLSGTDKFRAQFDWPGTQDPTPWLCIPAALEHVASHFQGGWPAVIAHGTALARQARDLLADALEVTERVPDSMLAAMATLPLPPRTDAASRSVMATDPLARELIDRHGIRAMVFDWPAHQARYLRVSAAPYNTVDEYRYLAECLKHSAGR